MKIAFAVLLFGASAWAQKPSAGSAAACGPANVNFNVSLDNTVQALVQPAPGKALVYFIHDKGNLVFPGYPTTKLGVDGAWAGANHGNSYFSLPIEPGEHHVCASLQSSLVSVLAELAHFSAEPGKVYYFRTRLIWSGEVQLLELEQIDSDQGKYLIDNYPLSISTPKK